MGNILSKLVNEVIREKKAKTLKEQLRRILLPIINEEVRYFREPTKHVQEFDKVLKSTCGDWCSVRTNLNQDRVIFEDGESGLNFSAELDIVGLDNFTLVYRLGNGEQRHKLFNQTSDDIKEWIKTVLKDRKKERTKQDKTDKADKKKNEVEEDLGAESTEVKNPDTQLDKAKDVDKEAKKVSKEEKPKGKDDDRGMKDGTKFKTQKDAKDKAEIAKGGKVSKKKEFPTDKEKTIKKPKMPNQA